MHTDNRNARIAAGMSIQLPPLPAPADRRIAVRVTPDALRQVRGGHPWVYDASILSTSHDGEPGDLAVIFDDKRDFAAIGLWDPESPIRLKVLHRGRPVPIDEAFWTQRLSTSRDRRRTLIDDPSTDGYRVVHGENDGLPGLVVDSYSDVVVVKLYSVSWIPHLRTVIDSLVAIVAPTTVVLRLSRTVGASATHGLHDGMTIYGPQPPQPVMFKENGLVFEADAIKGQKTGYFLDQRDNRQLVRERAEGASVLDVFSFTGGFSVHAAAGGARHVHSVDLSPHATESAARSVARNRSEYPHPVQHRTTTGDAFFVMQQLARDGDRYDIVVIDPPSFAQRQTSVPGALEAYRRLTALAVALISPGGLLVQASCSSRVAADTFFDLIRDSAATSGHRLREDQRTAHGIDHPIGFAQGAYLKALFARVDD